jgi:hypothetical protein
LRYGYNKKVSQRLNRLGLQLPAGETIEKLAKTVQNVNGLVKVWDLDTKNSMVVGYWAVAALGAG